MDEHAEVQYLPEWLKQLGYELKDRDGVRYIAPPLELIPSGKFLMGSDKTQSEYLEQDETPPSWVFLKAYEIGKYPVTVAEYRLFLKATSYADPRDWEEQKQRPEHPVVYVSWYDALAYAKWLSTVTGKQWKLPSEAEWEKAARGLERRRYVWGNEWKDRSANTGEVEIYETSPVGKYPRDESVYRVMDMTGNVWEWTSTRYKEYPYKENDGREETGSAEPRVVRGGSWAVDRLYARGMKRHKYQPEERYVDGGMRIKRDTIDNGKLPKWLKRLGYELQEHDGIQYIAPPVCAIPVGTFLMGSNKSKDKHAEIWETPQHIVNLPAYEIGKYPVTVAEYRLFIESMSYEEPQNWDEQKYKPEHPVVYVSWYDAKIYANWLSKMMNKQWKLPSEAEWEKAARGTDGRIYPWGDKWDTSKANTSENGQEETTPVGSYPQGASIYGVMDMAGNAREWTNTLYADYPYMADDGRENENSPNNRCIRGGSWDHEYKVARIARRSSGRSIEYYENRGFRLALLERSDDLQNTH